MKITNMIKSPHIADRYILELEDGTSLKIHINQIADYSLFTGRELTEEEYEDLRAAAGRYTARSRALRIIGSKPMSKKEIADRLITKGETEEAAEETAQWLQDIGAVDDREYAAMIVRHYHAKGYGAGKIKNELYRRKVPRELWDEAMEELPEDTEAIDRLVRMKLSGYEEPDRKTIKKLTDMLCRRGFSWEEIREALKRFEYELEGMD